MDGGVDEFIDGYIQWMDIDRYATFCTIFDYAARGWGSQGLTWHLFALASVNEWLAMAVLLNIAHVKALHSLQQTDMLITGCRRWRGTQMHLSNTSSNQLMRQS